MLTLEERERIAYIEGRTAEAALLAQLDDAEREIENQDDIELVKLEAYDEGYDDGYNDCRNGVTY